MNNALTKQLPLPIYGGRAGRETLPKNEKSLDTQPTEKDLTVKQRKWLDLYIKTGNATEAAFQVYDCKDRDSANAIGSENLAKLSFVDFLEQMGLSDKRLADALNEGLTATKPIGALILLDKDGNTISKENEGQIEVADYAIRHKYVESILKLKGRFRSAEVQILNQNIQPHGVPILRDMSVDFISDKQYDTLPSEELHTTIQQIQKVLAERKELQLEDHTDEQINEVINWDEEEKAIIDATPILKPQNVQSSITTRDPQDIQSQIDKKKQAAMLVTPNQDMSYQSNPIPEITRQENDPFSFE